MGTSAPPATGYLDDQRISNWDSPVLFTDTNRSVVGITPTPWLNVSRYAYIAGFDQFNGGDGTVGLTWASNPDGTQQVGTRNFVLSSQISDAAQYRLPNLGPYCQVQWGGTAAPFPTHTSTLFATNRFHPLEFIPMSAVLIHPQNIALGAGATSTLYPVDYYAGPIDVWMEFPAATWFWYLQYLDPNDVWQTIHVSPQSAGFVDQQIKTVTPPGAWRIRVSNSSAAAGSFSFGIKHSQTGST